MLKILLPAFRKRLDSDGPLHRGEVVLLKSIHPSDVRHADSLAISANQFHRIAGGNPALTQHGKVESCAATGEEPLDHVSASKLDPKLIAREPWLSDGDFGL